MWLEAYVASSKVGNVAVNCYSNISITGKGCTLNGCALILREWHHLSRDGVDMIAIGV